MVFSLIRDCRLRRELDPRHEKGEHSEESRGNAREESAASIGSIRRSPVTSLSVAIGTSQSEIRSLDDEADGHRSSGLRDRITGCPLATARTYHTSVNRG